MATNFLFKRRDKTGLLINLGEQCLQVARLAQMDSRPLVLDHITELPAGDDEAVKDWIDEHFPRRRGSNIPGYCGFHPAETVIARETLNPRRLTDPTYLQDLVADHAKISSAKNWHTASVHAISGAPLMPDGPARPALMLGVPLEQVRGTQRRLRHWGVQPRRIEIGTVPLLGGLARHLELNSYANALVVCELNYTQTRVYLLGKDGVHTPAPLPYGLLSIEESTMKELGLPDVATARRHLEDPPEELRAHSRRLVRMLSRHLRPAVDYFEMQTGQRSTALFCADLPRKLSWIGQALSSAVDLEFFTPDFPAWLASVGLQVEDVAALEPSWLQPLSLVAEVAPLRI